MKLSQDARDFICQALRDAIAADNDDWETSDWATEVIKATKKFHDMLKKGRGKCTLDLTSNLKPPTSEQSPKARP